MQETAMTLKSTRESAGVSLEEASKDLDIPVIYLEQIESGTIGSFDDIYELKQMLIDYAKYLGLDTEGVVNRFNEHMFDYTSKIPMDEIEKAVKEKQKEKEDEDRVFSPYTRITPKEQTIPFILSFIGIVILVICAVIWSVNKIKDNSNGLDLIGYRVNEWRVEK